MRPKPVVAVTNSSKAGDEIKYTVAYVLGVDGQQTVPAADVVPSSLEPGTTYVARLRARNFHGWSDWSSDVVFSGTLSLSLRQIKTKVHRKIESYGAEWTLGRFNFPYYNALSRMPPKKTPPTYDFY